MGDIKIPIDAVEAFSTDLGEFITELEQQRANVSTALETLYATWSGSAKNSFQESASSKDARFGQLIESFSSAQNVFTATVLPGLHSLQRTAAKLGDAFGVGSESDGGTLTLGSSGSALSGTNQTIQEVGAKATVNIDKALAFISKVISAGVSTAGISAIKTAVENNAESFQNITTGFSAYQISVQYYCRGLHQSFGVFNISDENKQIILNMDPSVLGAASQQAWAAAMYKFCMKDDSVWKNILSKDAADITPTEYALLASVYATLDPEKLDDFLTECMVCTENYEGDSFAGSHSYSKWRLDENKVGNIAMYSTLLYAVTLETLRNTPEGLPETWSEEYKQLLDATKQIMQRNVLLSELAADGIFYGDYNEPVSFNITYDNDKNLVVDYKKLITYTRQEYISSYGYGPGVTITRMESHLMPEKITIGAPVSGQNIKFDSLDKFEYVASSRFGVGQAAVSFADDTIRGAITEKAIGAAGDAITSGLKLTGKAAQFVPIVGDVISLGIDLGFELYDANQDTAFIHTEVDKMRGEFYYGDFDCNAVYVTKDTYNSLTNVPEQQIAVYVEEGRETRARIDAFNAAFPDSQISASALLDPQALSGEALKSNDSIFKIIDNARSQNKDYYDGIVNINLD